MSPTHAQKGDRRYRYYVSRQSDDAPVPNEDLWRLRAETIEAAILRGLAEFLRDPIRVMKTLDLESLGTVDLKSMAGAAVALADRLAMGDREPGLHREIAWVRRVGVDTDALEIIVDRQALAKRLLGNALDESIELHPVTAEMTVSTQVRRRGVEAKVILTGESMESAPPDAEMVSLLATARLWRDELMSGKANSVTNLARHHGADRGDVGKILALAYRAPDIVSAILVGCQPIELNVSRLKRLVSLPPMWGDQRRLLGFD